MCYNAIVKARSQSNLKSTSDSDSRKKAAMKSIAGNTMTRWDSDARDENGMTSEEVIVYWLTDEENCERYFGGKHGSKGASDGTRKDEYHNLLSQLIMEANGTY